MKNNSYIEYRRRRVAYVLIACILIQSFSYIVQSISYSHFGTSLCFEGRCDFLDYSFLRVYFEAYGYRSAADYIVSVILSSIIIQIVYVMVRIAQIVLFGESAVGWGFPITILGLLIFTVAPLYNILAGIGSDGGIYVPSLHKSLYLNALFIVISVQGIGIVGFETFRELVAIIFFGAEIDGRLNR